MTKPAIHPLSPTPCNTTGVPVAHLKLVTDGHPVPTRLEEGVHSAGLVDRASSEIDADDMWDNVPI